MIAASTYNEFVKIMARPRTYISFAAVGLLVGIIQFAMKIDGETYIGFITASFEQTLSFEGQIMNGNLMAFIVLQMLIVQIPLLVALVTGDLVSGEAAMGSIRFLLTRPVSRSGVLLSKYAAGLLYTFLLLIWLGLLSVVAGRLLFGEGDLLVLSSDGLNIIQAQDVNWRFAAGFAVAFLALSVVATLSLTLSCFSENSIGPIVSTMAIIILFTIIGTLDVPVFDHVRPYLFTTHMAAWRSFFDEPLIQEDIRQSVLVLLGHILVLLSVALWKFNRKDILS